MRFDPRAWLLAANGGPFATAADVITSIAVLGTADAAAGLVIVNFLHGLIRSAVTK